MLSSHPQPVLPSQIYLSCHHKTLHSNPTGTKERKIQPHIAPIKLTDPSAFMTKNVYLILLSVISWTWQFSHLMGLPGLSCCKTFLWQIFYSSYLYIMAPVTCIVAYDWKTTACLEFHAFISASLPLPLTQCMLMKENAKLFSWVIAKSCGKWHEFCFLWCIVVCLCGQTCRRLLTYPYNRRRHTRVSVLCKNE